MKPWPHSPSDEETRRRVLQYKSKSYKAAEDAAMDPRGRYVIELLGRFATTSSWAVIGEIAFGVWAQPRFTDHIEVLVEDPKVFCEELVNKGFQRKEDKIIVHEESEILIKVRETPHQEAFATAIQQENRIRMIGIPWLIFSLLPYVSRKDSIGLRAKADILHLLELYPNTNLEDLPLSEEDRNHILELRSGI